MEKTLNDIRVQKEAREAERNQLEDAVKAEQDAKDKHEKEQLEAALANFQQQKMELESRNENKPTVSENVDKSDPNKKELSLEMLLYVSRVPRDHKHMDKDFNTEENLNDKTAAISGAFPTDEEIINAAKVAVLLPYLQESERNNLAQMITQNSQVPLSAWHPESVMNGRQVLENYLMHISKPIKNGFKGPGRPKKEQESIDYVDILPEFRERVKNAHGIIDKVYGEQCQALDLVVKEQITQFLTNSNIFNASKKTNSSSASHKSVQKSSSSKNVHSATTSGSL